MPNNIVNIIVEEKKYFEGVELPNIKGFILNNHNALIEEIIQRQDFKARFLSDDPSKHRLLMMNFMVNPNLFYCHNDSVKGKYTQYFQPIYFSECIQKHINSNGTIKSKLFSDKFDCAIVKMHEDFDKHYNKKMEDRTYLSLNDLEVLSEKHIFPSPGSAIGFFRCRENISEYDDLYELEGIPKFAAHCKQFHTADTDRQSDINNIISVYKKGGSIDKFEKYLKHITCDSYDELGVIYYQYVAGSGDYWYGKCFFALRLPTNGLPVLEKELLEDVVHAAEHVLSALVLMGTTIRNRGITNMIGGLQRMMDSVDKFSRLNKPLWRQFGQPEWEVNRAKFTELFEVLRDSVTDQSELTDGSSISSNGALTEDLDRIGTLAPNIYKYLFQYYASGDQNKDNFEHLLKNNWFIVNGGEHKGWVKDMHAHLEEVFHIDSARSPTIITYYAEAIAFGHWGKPYGAMKKENVFSAAESSGVPKLPDPFLKATVALLFHETMVRSNLQKIIGISKFNSSAYKFNFTRNAEKGYYDVEVTYTVTHTLQQNEKIECSDVKKIDIDYSVVNSTHRHKFMCVLLFAKTFLPKAEFAIVSGIEGKILALAYYGNYDLLNTVEKEAKSSMKDSTGIVWSRYVIRVYV